MLKYCSVHKIATWLFYTQLGQQYEMKGGSVGNELSRHYLQFLPFFYCRHQMLECRIIAQAIAVLFQKHSVSNSPSYTFVLLRL